jgi:long-chain acyl-CoA synthetase
MGTVKYRNFHAMIEEIVRKRPNLVAFKWFVDNQGNRDGVTWTQFYEQAKQVAKSLIALGVEKDDKVNIISNTCYRWTLTDIGIIFSGGVTVGVYQSNLAEGCRYIIDHSDAVVVFVEDDLQLKKVLEIRDRIPKVRKVVMIKGRHDDDWVITYEEFLALGRDVSDDVFRRRATEPDTDDAATLVYTSGTTGPPKGAILTHGNVIFSSQAACDSFKFQDGDEMVLFLPLAHVMARLAVYISALAGTSVTYARGLETAVEDIVLAKPHWIPSVPRVYEKIYAKVISGAEAKGGVILKLFNWACKVGIEVSACREKHQPVPAFTAFQYAIASKLVFSKLRGALGGRVRWMLSGGAALNEDIVRFFHAAGIIVVEGIGMTENASFSHVNRIDNYKIGTVGQPAPGVEAKTAPDGELLIRGGNVMKGYYKMPEETKAAFTEDGWLITGDLAEIDQEGFLKITGRKKEIIITSGGKNIAPLLIEGILGTSIYINQVMVVGEGKKYLSALVTLDPATVPEYAQKNGIAFTDLSDLGTKPEIVQLIDREVAEKNKQLASYETIKKVAIVPEFTIDNGLITPTLKLKKNLVKAKYKDIIENMYT